MWGPLQVDKAGRLSVAAPSSIQPPSLDVCSHERPSTRCKADWVITCWELAITRTDKAHWKGAHPMTHFRIVGWITAFKISKTPWSDIKDTPVGIKFDSRSRWGGVSKDPQFQYPPGCITGKGPSSREETGPQVACLGFITRKMAGTPGLKWPI